MIVYSPFNPETEAIILEEIATKEIVNGYQTTYGINVQPYFKNLERIYVCECPLTQLKFYHPFGLDGDAHFYKHFSQYPWYYQAERWEHKEAIQQIPDAAQLLEVGSGSGSFLKLVLKTKAVNYCGLELNPSAIETASQNGIVLTNEPLHTHAKTHANHYDIVCSFQVYEHISAIGELITDSLHVLKKGGLLLIAVPNNDANFIKYNTSNSKYLNTPPHHVNLFNEASLRGLAKFYKLELKQVIKEPLQDLHVDVYLYTLVSKLFFNRSFLIRAFWKLRLHIPLRPIVKLRRNAIIGHTIIGVFQK